MPKIYVDNRTQIGSGGGTTVLPRNNIHGIFIFIWVSNKMSNNLFVLLAQIYSYHACIPYYKTTHTHREEVRMNSRTPHSMHAWTMASNGGWKWRLYRGLCGRYRRIITIAKYQQRKYIKQRVLKISVMEYLLSIYTRAENPLTSHTHTHTLEHASCGAQPCVFRIIKYLLWDLWFFGSWWNWYLGFYFCVRPYR